MSYPPAPWSLQGYAYVTLQTIAVDRARRFVPSELEIVSVLPGQTIGGVYLSSYQAGSVLQYNELIVVAALVRYRDKIGSWVSHIYVDNPDSVAGGREIWGLPKELAAFSWQGNEAGSVTVQKGSQLLCRLDYQEKLSFWRQSISALSLSTRSRDLLAFEAQAAARFSWISARLDIPAGSPFAELGVGQPWLAIAGKELDLSVKAPIAIGQCSAEADRVAV